jgi:hypothetical protein
MNTLVAALAVLALAGPAFAQVKYVDEAGNPHYAQSENMVPKRYRAKAKPLPRLPWVRIPGTQGGAEWSGPLQKGSAMGPTRVEMEDQQRAGEMASAAAQNAAQKREDQSKKDEFNRCVGTKGRTSPCF